MQSDTPQPGEDPGTLIEDEPGIEPASDAEIEADPQPQPELKPLVPQDDNPEVEETEEQPT